jgi:protein gp37
MGEGTLISWCDFTFNGWLGCAEVSPACNNCYARAFVEGRFNKAKWGAKEPRVRTSAANWKKPLTWNRQAERDGTRPFVFCSSLADVNDNQVPAWWRRDLFDLIHATPNLTWLLLTKRPGNFVKLFDLAYRPNGDAQSIGERAGNWPRNAAIGCTVVSQEEADRDVPKLLEAKALLKPAFAFLSMEPLLGPVDLDSAKGGTLWIGGQRGCGGTHRGVGTPDCPREPHHHHDERCGEGLDWVIVGGESGPNARPMDMAWARDLERQCDAAGVPFHFKQVGGRGPDKGGHLIDGRVRRDRPTIERLAA